MTKRRIVVKLLLDNGFWSIDGTNMQYTYEFEFVSGDKNIVVLPFDFDGATQGDGLKDAAEAAADWLKNEIECRLMLGEDIPEPTFGSYPAHDHGRIVIVSVMAGLETVDVVSATEAARRLGVSNARISQMLKSNLLMGYRKGRDTLVSIQSISARLADSPKPGRPHKEKPRELSLK